MGPTTNLTDEIECLRNVPEHYDPVEPYFGLTVRSGETLDGRFRLGEPIYNHGMATIFKAQDLADHGQTVAVKVPHLKYEFLLAIRTRRGNRPPIGPPVHS
jgi:hypothetical protein